MKNKSLSKLALQAKMRLMGQNELENVNQSKDARASILISDEEEFYAQVCALMEENPDMMNPIARLIDHKIYDNMQESSKQKYFFELIDKYLLCKARYEKEHQDEIA